MVKALDVKDMKIFELVKTNETIELDNIHKKRLLNEKQEFVKTHFMNKILEECKQQYRDEIDALKLTE